MTPIARTSAVAARQDRHGPESPHRIRRFLHETRSLDWSGASAMRALRDLYQALDDLAQEEVRYYHRRRRTRAWISGVCRVAAWTLGTAGLLAPLVAAARPDLKEATSYGYVLLAGAAAALGANALFGGTVGHVRFVQTQLALERLIALTRIRWCRFERTLATGAPAAGDAGPSARLDEGFDLLMSYAEALYVLTMDETGAWAKTLTSELERFQASLAPPKPAPAAAEVRRG